MMQKGMTLTCVNTDFLPGNTFKPNLEADRTYILKNIHICDCGQHHFDVGLPLTIGFVTCYNCKKELPKKVTANGMQIHWCHPTRFKETA